MTGRASVASQLVVVIRTAGERTFPLCRSLLARQVPESIIHVVEERPFEVALRSCYQIGIESGAEWMMTVDGDVLVRDGAVNDLLVARQRLPDRCVQLEGLIHDRLLGGYRRAGHRLYRTAHLHEAMAAIPGPGEELRPEFSTLGRLSRLGFPSAECAVVFGLHDHEQFYRDLYRKAFVHGQKHPEWLGEVLPRWRGLGVDEGDFRVTIRGYLDGFQAQTRATIDAGEYDSLSEQAMKDLGITEKPRLSDDEGSLAAIAALQANLLAGGPPTWRATLRSKFKTSYGRLGAIRMVPYVVGSALYHIGDYVRGWVERE